MTIHEMTRSDTKYSLFRVISCDLVDRLLPLFTAQSGIRRVVTDDCEYIPTRLQTLSAACNHNLPGLCKYQDWRNLSSFW